MFFYPLTSLAAGPFGPPEPQVRESGGLHTAFGYWRSETRYENGTDYTFTQNRLYSEAGYGSRNWEIYGRIGLADLDVSDAFRPSVAGVTASKGDFQDNWSVFGTIGGKIFYAANETLGVGSFVQATYSGDFNDKVTGTSNGVPFSADIRVENPWDLAFGMAIQAKILGTKLYAGPYFSYAEAKISPSARVGGITFTAEEFKLRNKNRIGGVAGIDLPLYKLFHLNIEGQYSDRFSVGAAIALVY